MTSTVIAIVTNNFTLTLKKHSITRTHIPVGTHPNTILTT